MSTVLITGAGGFLARSLYTLLAERADEIVRTDMTAQSGAGVVACDLSRYEETHELIRKEQPSHVYNLAGSFSNNYETDWKANCVATKNLLDAILEENFNCKTLLVGSAAEYGPVRAGENPVAETRPLRPATVYGLTKAMQTLLMGYYAGSRGLNIVMARPFNLLGKGASTKLFIGRVYQEIERLKLGLSTKVRVGHLENRRDYIDVAEAAAKIELVMQKGVSGEVYNIGSGRSTRIYDVLERILAENGLSMDVVESDSEDRARRQDPDDVFADISKLTALEKCDEAEGNPQRSGVP